MGRGRKDLYRRVIRIRPICILLMLALSVSSALGDVRISHSYSTGGGEASDDVYLHNIDYSNSVSIYQDSLFAEADSVINDKDEKALFSNRVVTRGEGSAFGANLKAGAEEKFSHHMSLSTGSHASDATGISYNLEKGFTVADYFTSKGSVFEGVIVDNVDYANKAAIYPEYLSCSADADLVKGKGIGLLMDNILTDSNEGEFGTALVAMAGVKLDFEKEFRTGSLVDDKSNIGYTFESGIADANYFNPLTRVNEFVSTDSCRYKGSIKNSVEEISSKGYGRITEDDYGAFTHDVSVLYDGRPFEIAASLVTGDEAYGSRPEVPAVYRWDTTVESNEDHAKSTVSAKGWNGNRDVDLVIEGKSVGLADKIAGPMHISPLGFIGISKELYMSYEINR